ncbi:MAG: hypothetical protein NTW86_08610 [Candidatus Sumerlaeota bacterium]|nr:hypothetical protein [Candidatus Sumerlaeota bacterium]
MSFRPFALAIIRRRPGTAGEGGRVNADELTDAPALSFTETDKRRVLVRLEKATGTTFEIEAPWGALGLSKPPERLRAIIRVERPDGAAIQAPAGAANADPNTWLALNLEP